MLVYEKCWKESDIIKLKCPSKKSKNPTELSDPTLTKIKEELVVGLHKEESDKYFFTNGMFLN